MGGRENPFMDESIQGYSHLLDEETGKFHRSNTFGVRVYYAGAVWPIGIGSKPLRGALSGSPFLVASFRLRKGPLGPLPEERNDDPLTRKEIKAMQVRGFSVRTHESYLNTVTDLARYFHRAPDELGIEDLRRYFEYLATERSLSGASCRLFLNGLRFLYLQVLEWPTFDVDIPIPKKAQRIPEQLTRAEVGRILSACANPSTGCY